MLTRVCPCCAVRSTPLVCDHIVLCVCLSTSQRTVVLSDACMCVFGNCALQSQWLHSAVETTEVCVCVCVCVCLFVCRNVCVCVCVCVCHCVCVCVYDDV